MRFPFFQVDAFSSRALGGNPAAVCLLDVWPEDELLLAVAGENNLSETAFLVPEADGWRLRWFAPRGEVTLCGHATLAAAQVLAEVFGHSGARLRFFTLSGPLNCYREASAWRLDFPALALQPSAIPELPGMAARAAWTGLDTVLELPDVAAVAGFDPDWALQPDFDRTRGLCITAAGDDCHFVSRFFAPRLGIPEDPVTGSAHCALAPLWGERLGRTLLSCRQLSPRGGVLKCRVAGKRVHLIGEAVVVIRGHMYL